MAAITSISPRVTSPRVTPPRVTYDVATDGLAAIVEVETLACGGQSIDVQAHLCLRGERTCVLGTAVGIVRYFRILGFSTSALEADLSTNGPLDQPEHLHLADVILVASDGERRALAALRVHFATIVNFELELQLAG